MVTGSYMTALRLNLYTNKMRTIIPSLWGVKYPGSDGQAEIVKGRKIMKFYKTVLSSG